MRRAVRLTASLLAGGLLLLAGAASASAHFRVLIREVQPTAPLSNAAFIELQSYEPGQTFLGGQWIDTYDAAGNKIHTFTMPTSVANGDAQRTVLIGDGDLLGTADYHDPQLGDFMPAAGGAACFFEALPPDCVSWGAFSGNAALPTPGAGIPAPAVPAGQSLTRTLARDCATSLDPADDSDSSMADFALGAPTPRPNSAAPSERDCVPCGGQNATIIGTDGKETIKGTKRPDVIAALAGKDKVLGKAGNDVICGGVGKDTLNGGKGRDRLLGERGSDTCIGGPGRDTAKSCEAPDSR